MPSFYKKLCVIFMMVALTGCQLKLCPGLGLLRLVPNDQGLTQSVHDAFIQDPLLTQTPLHVEVKNGVVYLSGYVKTIRQSDTAEAVAKRVCGVKWVENNIVVRK